MKLASRKLKVIAIVGPTSSGKSELAVLLAKKFNGEIISADSRQVYRGLDIGTGKVPLKNWGGKLFYKGIRHHLLNVTLPMRQFSVAAYQKIARRVIEDITKRGKLPILCGGTGLYVDATLYDFSIPKIKPNKTLRKKLEQKSAEELFGVLKLKDPDRARTIDRLNKRRLIRALEIIETTGASVPPLDQYYAHPARHASSTAGDAGGPRYDILKIGIWVPQKTLKERIHKRLIARMRQGMVREVQMLLTRKEITPKRLEELGLEYRYVGRYLALRLSSRQAGKITKQEISKEAMIAQLEKEIWRYGKRQMTWLRRDPRMVWISNERKAIHLLTRFLSANYEPLPPSGSRVTP